MTKITGLPAATLPVASTDMLELVQSPGGTPTNVQVSVGDLPTSSPGALDSLSDVDTTTAAPTDGQSLVFDSASGLWVPGTVSGGGGTDALADVVRTTEAYLAKPAATLTVEMGAGNVARFMRVAGTGTITKVGVRVGTTGGNIDVGIYSNTGTGRSATPGSRKGSSGSVPTPAAGYSTVNLTASVSVVDGDWFALAADGVTQKFLGYTLDNAGSNLSQGMSRIQNPLFPLGATASAGLSNSDRVITLAGVP